MQDRASEWTVLRWQESHTLRSSITQLPCSHATVPRQQISDIFNGIHAVSYIEAKNECIDHECNQRTRRPQPFWTYLKHTPRKRYARTRPKYPHTTQLRTDFAEIVFALDTSLSATHERSEHERAAQLDAANERPDKQIRAHIPTKPKAIHLYLRLVSSHTRVTKKQCCRSEWRLRSVPMTAFEAATLNDG